MSAQVLLECVFNLFVILLDEASELEELRATVGQWKSASSFKCPGQPVVKLWSGLVSMPTLQRGQT